MLFKLKLIQKTCFPVFLFFLIFTVKAQAEPGRPLRSSPDSSSLIPVSHSTSGGFSIPAASLITPEALEHPLTQRYIEQYTRNSGILYLNAALERGSIYLPFIKEEVARRNLPPELIYLPLIESSFVITARSRSGAVGLWQFMMNSISPFDIKVNDMVDERRDFIKSTRGALQKLEDNYRTLGNWELALAAYNFGLGGMNRIIQRTKVRDYWELNKRGELRQETAHYVPKLVAACYVLSQPRKYGINVWNKPLDWTAIALPRQISLDMLADETGIEKDVLVKLNAELLHGITPADRSYRLVVPTAYLEQVNQTLSREDLALIRYHYHVVRHGDTLWSMSRHYGTDLNLIEQHNPGIGNRYLKIGETVVIPAFGEGAATPTAMPAATQAFNGSHVVQKGETFWSLGRRYGVDPQALAEENNMRIDQILHEGRTLKVPILQ